MIAMRTLTGAVLLTTGICLMNATESNSPVGASERDLIVIAHRGGVVDGNRPENSLAALQEAIRRGYTHVEIDVRSTLDGAVVCFHDGNLKRETGFDKRLSELNLEELKKYRLKKTGEPIPTLDEFCARCAGKIEVMIDIKGVEDRLLDRYSEEIESVLRKHDLLENALILIDRKPLGNQARVAERFLGRAKIAWRKPLTESVDELRALGNAGQLYYVFNHGADFDQTEVQGFQAIGLKVIVSINFGHYQSVDSLDEGLRDARRVLDLGVDGLQIDAPYDSVVFDERAFPE
jgi:glycerophosphoryl diester phosphodiesterase